jgi:replicative DNA helicase
MADLISTVTMKQAEIEKSLIGCLVIAQEYVMSECSWLDSRMFANQRLGELWQGCVDGGEVMEVASKLDMTTEVFGYMNHSPSFQQAGQFANAIAQKNYFRMASLSMGELARAIDTQDQTEIERVLDYMKGLDNGQSTEMRLATDIAESLIDRIELGDISIPFGIKSADWATGGAEIGTCTVVAARTSMGKSALAMEFAENQALEQGKKVGFFALEMSAEQLMARRNCHKAKNLQSIPASWQDVRSRNIDDNNRLALYELVRSYAERIKGKLCIHDGTHVTMNDIIRIQAREQFDVIYIDHLGLLKDVARRGERHDQLRGRQVMMCHELAKDTQCVVILLAQLNREVGSRSGNKPTLTDLRDSGQIEENADNVILLHRDSYWDASLSKDVDPMECIIAKYRDGARASSFYVGFDLAAQKFVTMWAEDLEKLADKRMEDDAEQTAMPLEEDNVPDIPF